MKFTYKANTDNAPTKVTIFGHTFSEGEDTEVKDKFHIDKLLGMNHVGIISKEKKAAPKAPAKPNTPPKAQDDDKDDNSTKSDETTEKATNVVTSKSYAELKAYAEKNEIVVKGNISQKDLQKVIIDFLVKKAKANEQN